MAVYFEGLEHMQEMCSLIHLVQPNCMTMDLKSDLKCFDILPYKNLQLFPVTGE